MSGGKKKVGVKKSGGRKKSKGKKKVGEILQQKMTKFWAKQSKKNDNKKTKFWGNHSTRECIF